MMMAPRQFLLVSMVIACLVPSVHMASANGTEGDITRTGCDMSKFCVEDPVGCDPAVDGSCLFASIMAGPVETNGSDLSITLRGETEGYVALGLRPTANASVGTAMLFACGQVKGSFRFDVTVKNNSNDDSFPSSSNSLLSAGNRAVEEVQGHVNGSVVQCSFTVPGVNAMAMGSSHVTTFVVQLGTGTINETVLGPFNVKKVVGPVDVANLTHNDAPTTETPTMNSTSMPMNSTSMPMNSTSMPMNSTSMPMNSTSMPMNSTSMPMTSTSMPMNTTSIPTTGSGAITFSSSVSLIIWSFLTWSTVLQI